MSKQKGLSEIVESECHGSDESKLGSIQTAHEKKDHTYLGHSKQQKDDLPKDPPKSIVKDADLKAFNVLQAKSIDTTYSIASTIQDLNKTVKSETLKTFMDRWIKQDGINWELGNIGSEVQTSGIDYYAYVQNMLSAYDNVDASTLRSLYFVLHALKENRQSTFVASPDGDGGHDPDYTKLTVDPPPLGRSSHLPAASTRYLIQLEAKTEIHTKVVTKEGNSDGTFCKMVTPSIDKCSWREACEKNYVDPCISEEEEGSEGLASTDCCYCGEEIDAMIDQSVTCGLDADAVQQFNDKQAGESVEDQDGKGKDSDVNDSSSETRENGSGSDVLLSEGMGASVQIRLTADEGVVVEAKDTVDSGSYELVGEGQTIPIDYTLQQSTLVGKQSYPSVYTHPETAGIKHHLLTNSGYTLGVNTNQVIANLTADTTFQDTLSVLQEEPNDLLLHGDDGLNNEAVEQAVEQDPEPPPTYPLFAQPVPPPTTIKYVLQFPQPEDQPAPLCNKVDTPTEETEMPEDLYVDAVEAQPEDSEDTENYPQSLFVSSPADNFDDYDPEAMHLERRKPSRWSNCCLL